VATVFNFGRVIAASSGLFERTGSISVVMYIFSLLALGYKPERAWDFCFCENI
jgi:hypothetical protein